MSDQLAEALERMEATYFGQHEHGLLLTEFIREHLSCSTITNEQVDEAAKAIYYEIVPAHNHDEHPWETAPSYLTNRCVQQASAALEAAARVK